MPRTKKELPALDDASKILNPDLPDVASKNYTDTILKYGGLATKFPQLETEAKTVVAAINELNSRPTPDPGEGSDGHDGSLVIANPPVAGTVLETGKGELIQTNVGKLIEVSTGELVGPLYSINIDDEIYTIDTGVAYLNELVDVTIEEPHSGQVLKYDGEQWVNAEDASGISKLSELEDVELSEDPTQGQVLTYDGTDWVNADPASVPSTLDDLTNVDIDEPINGQVLTYDDGEWVNAVPVSSLESLSDVDITSATNGQVLKYNNGEWVNATDLDTNKLSDLQDVDVASVTTGQVLKFDGTEWVGGDDGPDTLEELTDTSISSKQNNDEIVYNSTSQKWENKQVHKTLTNAEYNALSSAEKNNGTIYFISDIPAVTLRPEDLVSTNALEGQLLWYNGAVWEPVYGITQLQDNDVLIYDETLGTWRNGPVGSLADLGDLNDVSITSAVDGQVLKYNGSEWVNAEDSGVASLEDLTDVDITSASNGQVLTYSNGDWINTDPASVPSALEDLTDVTITSATLQSGQVLQYDGSDWVNADASNVNIWEGTQAQYDAILVKDPDTVYYITDGATVACPADEISYDNTTSGLTSTDVQDAIDEIAGSVGSQTLDGLNDVDIDSLTLSNGQVLAYDSTGTEWVNHTLWTDLTATLAAGSTSLTIQNSVITTTSTIEVFADNDIDYNSITVTTGQIVLTFDAQVGNIGIKVRVS